MRRWVLAFLMAVTANWVSLIYAFGPVSWLLTTILLLGEFLYFNLRPIEKSGAPTKRIWYLKSGCELLRLFLITATVTVFVQMVWLWCQISMITPENSLAAGTAVAGAAFGVLWAVLLEAIVFWNGMIRVYLTSVQLGLKHRVLAALCGWIPILNIWYLRKIIRITADEAEFETEKWELDTARAESEICKTKYPILLSTGCSSGTSAMSTTGAAFPRSSSATAQQCTTDSAVRRRGGGQPGGSWRTVSGRSWRRPGVRR